MSPPDTNVKTQARRHRPALIGILLAVGFAAILFAAWVFLQVSPDIEGADVLPVEAPMDQAAPVDPGSTGGTATIEE